MKFNHKRIMSITLATLITVGSTGIYAASFSDVPNTHWAKKTIDKGEELGLLKGFEDGTFKPSTSVSRLQTLIMLTRISKPSQTEIDKATEKYKAELLKNKVADWALGELSVAFSREIADTSLLSNLYTKNGAESLGTREEVAIFVARAMGLEKEVKDKGVITKLPFVDAAKVTKAAMPYVLVMKEKGIMVGDTSRNFNPKSPISRAEMSVVLNAAVEYMEKKDEEKPKPEPENPKPEPEKPQVTTVVGTTYNTYTSGDSKYIIIDSVMGERKSYKIDEKSILKLDDKIVSYEDLVSGMKVKVEVTGESEDSQGTVVSLTGESLIERYEGSIHDVTETSTKTLTLEYRSNNSTTNKLFVVENSANILLDGIKADFSELRDNDKVSIEVINGKISRIDAQSAVRNISGILKEVDSANKSITVETQNGTRTLYSLNNNVSIMRNNRSAYLSDLRRGDKVDIRVEDRLVVKIDAKIVEKEVIGLVQKTSIGYDKTEITILNNETKREETYTIPSLAEVLLDGQLARVDQFKLGYYTKLKLEGEEVVKLEGESTISSKHLGRITSKGLTKLEILLDNGKYIEVEININTLVKNDLGNTINFESLSIRDNVLITGDVYQGKVIAKEIMRLTK